MPLQNFKNFVALNDFHGIQELKQSVEAKMTELNWKSDSKKLIITHWLAPSFAAVGLLSALFGVYRFSLPDNQAPRANEITLVIGELVAQHFPILFLFSFLFFLATLLWVVGCDGIAAIWHGRWKQNVLAIPRIFGILRKPWLIVIAGLIATLLSFLAAIWIFNQLVLSV